MTLKAQMLADLPVFTNTDEFGELRSIDGGGPVASILDDEQGVHTAEGVYVVLSTLYLKTASLSSVPVVGQRITVDSRPANVVHVDDTDGLLTLKLQWFDS